MPRFRVVAELPNYYPVAMPNPFSAQEWDTHSFEVDGELITYKEPKRAAPPAEAAEQKAFELFREIIGEEAWAQWCRQRAVTLFRRYDGLDLKFHITPHFVMVANEHGVFDCRCIYTQDRVGPVWSSWSIGDMMLALYLITKYDPHVLFRVGYRQIPAPYVNWQIVTVTKIGGGAEPSPPAAA